MLKALPEVSDKTTIVSSIDYTNLRATLVKPMVFLFLITGNYIAAKELGFVCIKEKRFGHIYSYSAQSISLEIDCFDCKYGIGEHEYI